MCTANRAERFFSRLSLRKEQINTSSIYALGLLQSNKICIYIVDIAYTTKVYSITAGTTRCLMQHTGARYVCLTEFE